MRPLRKLIVTMNGHFDNMVSQIENNEAIATSIIDEVESAGAKARVQLKRVKGDLNKISQKKKSLNQEINTWKQRALRTHQGDEDLALECMARVKRLAQELENIENQERKTIAIESQLSEDLQKVEDKLQDLRLKRRALMSRQSSVQALALTQNDNSDIMSEIEHLFDRWETKISKYEIMSSRDSVPMDPLAAKFDKEERSSDLKDELKQLVDANKGGKDHE